MRILSSGSLVNIIQELILCPQNCGKSYKNISCLNKHLKYECNKPPQFACLFCDKKSKRPDNLRTHMQLVHRFTKKRLLTIFCATIAVEDINISVICLLTRDLNVEFNQNSAVIFVLNNLPREEIYGNI